ncbi:hypothetical protein KR200_004336 [Drosophila serrata]|nr:hypothetical protein KR200_004336 [Drosophila serrata]
MLPPPPLNLSSYYILDTILEEQSLMLPDKKPGCLRRVWNFFGLGKARHSASSQHTSNGRLYSV